MQTSLPDTNVVLACPCARKRREADAQAASRLERLELPWQVHGDCGGGGEGARRGHQARVRHLLAQQGTWRSPPASPVVVVVAAFVSTVVFGHIPPVLDVCVCVYFLLENVKMHLTQPQKYNPFEIVQY